MLKRGLVGVIKRVKINGKGQCVAYYTRLHGFRVGFVVGRSLQFVILSKVAMVYE